MSLPQQLSIHDNVRVEKKSGYVVHGQVRFINGNTVGIAPGFHNNAIIYLSTDIIHRIVGIYADSLLYNKKEYRIPTPKFH